MTRYRPPPSLLACDLPGRSTESGKPSWRNATGPARVRRTLPRWPRLSPAGPLLGASVRARRAARAGASRNASPWVGNRRPSIPAPREYPVSVRVPLPHGGAIWADSEEGPDIPRAGAVSQAVRARFRCLLDVRTLPGSNPPPDRAFGSTASTGPLRLALAQRPGGVRPPTGESVLDFEPTYRVPDCCQPPATLRGFTVQPGDGRDHKGPENRVG